MCRSWMNPIPPEGDKIKRLGRRPAGIAKGHWRDLAVPEPIGLRPTAGLGFFLIRRPSGR